MTAPYLVLGLGNILFQDEGVGVAAAERLAEHELDGVEVLDGSTLGIALLPMIAGRRGLVVLDALASSAAEPGTVVRLDDADIERHRRMAFSVHQIDLVDALLAAELSGCAPKYLAIVGLVPASIETGYGLTPTAEAGLDEMVRRALEILAGWGVRERARA